MADPPDKKKKKERRVFSVRISWLDPHFLFARKLEWLIIRGCSAMKFGFLGYHGLFLIPEVKDFSFFGGERR